MTNRLSRLYLFFLKPASDMLLAWVLLVLFLPLMLLLAMVLTLTNRGDFLFIQKRTGYKGRTFYLYKFCTMRNVRDENGHLRPDADRQFAVGNFLRHYHLDELPQLLNVGLGQLSFIGPRPLLPEYLPHYNERQQKRHLVRPGMIGLSQCLGGNRLPWTQRLRLDSFYAQKTCFILDMKILSWSFFYFLRKGRKLDNQGLFSTSFLAEKQA